MSQFIGGALHTGLLSTKDDRLVLDRYSVIREHDMVVDRYSATQFPGGYVTPFWPGNSGSGFIGDQGTDTSMMQSVWNRSLERFSYGAASRFGFVGTTRDQFGTAVGGVTCSLFRTIDRQWIADVVSGADGTFLLQTVYGPDTHFIVFNKVGGPTEIFGTTRQSLVGA